MMSKNVDAAPEVNENDPYVFTDLGHELTNGFAHKFIRFKVRQIIGCVGLPRSRREELEQDLRLLLIRRFPMFDPKIAQWPAYVVAVIERRIATIVEHGQFLDRSGLTNFVSLSESAIDEEGLQVELADQMSPDHQGKVSGLFKRTETERFAIRHDLELAMPTLTDEQRATCELLKRMTVKSLARRRGHSRNKLRNDLIPIREQLDRKGISEF